MARLSDLSDERSEKYLRLEDLRERLSEMKIGDLTIGEFALIMYIMGWNRDFPTVSGGPPQPLPSNEAMKKAEEFLPRLKTD